MEEELSFISVVNCTGERVEYGYGTHKTGNDSDLSSSYSDFGALEHMVKGDASLIN